MIRLAESASPAPEEPVVNYLQVSDFAESAPLSPGAIQGSAVFDKDYLHDDLSSTILLSSIHSSLTPYQFMIANIFSHSFC